jgi:uncharacterized membrane protein YfcA
VIEFPDSSHFAALLADPRFYAVVGVTVLAGVVRGFSGFGSALIYIPLVSAIYEPKIAAASFLLIDLFCAAPFAWRLYPISDKREIWPLTIAAALTIPLGALLLRYIDPEPLRWSIAILIFALLAVLVSGWRMANRSTLPLTVFVGLISGVLGGATQLVGVLAIIYWLGSPNSPAVMRANMMVFFAMAGVVILITYAVQGLFPPEIIALSLLIALPYIAMLGAGAWLFKGSSELVYRRIAYAIVALAALVSLPAFDGLIR